MNKLYLLILLMSLCMFNLFGQNKSESGKNQYKFKDPENTACFVCNHVLSKERPILYAAHDEEGDWQFLCGLNDHTEENAKIISLKQVTEIDQSVNELYEMPVKIGAERKTVTDKWIPFKLQE